VAPSKGGGDVEVIAAIVGHESPGQLRLTVRNTGAPLHTVAPRHTGDHVGVDNIRRRLAGHYRDQASLTLATDAHGNTVAEIVLPVIDQTIALEDHQDAEAVASRPR
jgi:LytS/YehU family sensor histidine kinase